MLGVLVNTVAVLIGSTIGLAVKKGLPKRFSDAIMLGIGLCTLYIGISGTLKGENTVVLIVSVAAGAAAGTALRLDGRINALGVLVESRFKTPDGGGVPIAQGFVTASLLFCVGSMTIVGSLNAGLMGDNEMLYTKSMLDLISSIMLSASLGAGVIFAAAVVLLFQGALVLLAGLLKPLFDNPAIIAEMTCAGSLAIVALGLNLIGVTKIKVADYLPAIIIAPVLCWIITFF